MAKSVKGSMVWSTADELEFLDELKVSNPMAYRNYVLNFESRSNWGKLDREEIALFIGLSTSKKYI